MNSIEGFLLGLGTGATCLFSCGPILIPFLLGERKGLLESFGYVGQFLGGRLLAYLILGFLVGLVGQSLEINEHIWWLGVVYCMLSILMIGYGFHRFRQICLGHLRRKVESRLRSRFPAFIPLCTGFLTSLSICPPLLLAISKASAANSILGSICTFGAFFVGTAIYFLPLPIIALLRRNQVLQIIGKYAAIITGLLFFYKGVIIIINSI